MFSAWDSEIPNTAEIAQSENRLFMSLLIKITSDSVSMALPFLEPIWLFLGIVRRLSWVTFDAPNLLGPLLSALNTHNTR